MAAEGKRTCLSSGVLGAILESELCESRAKCGVLSFRPGDGGDLLGKLCTERIASSVELADEPGDW